MYNIAWAHALVVHSHENSKVQDGDEGRGKGLFAAGGKTFFITDGEPFNTAAFGVFEPVREEKRREQEEEKDEDTKTRRCSL